MGLDNVVLTVTTTLAIVTAIAAVVKDRRKPVLDEAQAQQAIVNSDAVKAEIRRMSEMSNLQRDLRILDLERWGDEMRPWASSVVHEFEKLCELMREDREALGLEMPEIHIQRPPPFPPPRPVPG